MSRNSNHAHTKQKPQNAHTIQHNTTHWNRTDFSNNLSKGSKV